MRTKPIKINVRLTLEQHEYLRSRSQDLFGGNLSQAVVSLISEVNRGSSPPSLAGMGKAESSVLTDQVAHRAFPG